MRITQVLRGMALLAAITLASSWLVWQLGTRGEPGPEPDPLAASSSAAARDPTGKQQIERGAYLARAGNCMGCHSARGGTPYAGGRAIDTPFGAVFSSNLTPDNSTGLGNWLPGDFWRALHHGRSKDGRLLVPAFPYSNYTQFTREDSDALFAFLKSLPATVQANQAHALRFPYGSQAALAVWRALYFKPGADRPEPGVSAEVERGAYLVKGLGHCSACHGARNAVGATARSTGDPARVATSNTSLSAGSAGTVNESRCGPITRTSAARRLASNSSPSGPLSSPGSNTEVIPGSATTARSPRPLKTRTLINPGKGAGKAWVRTKGSGVSSSVCTSPGVSVRVVESSGASPACTVAATAPETTGTKAETSPNRRARATGRPANSTSSAP